jgi:tetratricopeptide (TPR) repeat protein
MNQRNSIVVLTVLAFAGCAVAQDDAKPAPFSVEQAVAEAKAGLDRAEALPERPVSREALAEVNEKIVAIETHDPGNVWLPYLYGRAFFLMGQTSEAAAKLRAFVDTREGKNEWRAFCTLGDLFVGEFPNLANSYYLAAVDLNSTDSGIYHGLSMCASRRGAMADAVRLARQAVQVGGGDDVAHLAHLARVLAADQQWREADSTAVLAVERAKALASERAGVRAPLEDVVLRYAQLITILQNKLAATGAGGDEYLRLAKYVEERADVARRAAKFDTLGILETGVEATEPRTPVSLLEKYAVTLAEVGRKDDAIAAFEDLLTRDADNATAKEWLTRLNAPVAHKSAP